MNRSDGEALRKELRLALGVALFPSAPAVEVVSSDPQDGYVRHLVRLITDDDSIPAFLATPLGDGPFGAVAIFHQHAGQRHLGKSELFGLAGDPVQAFGPALAQRGLVVLAPDSIAFEDRRRGGGIDPRDDDWEQHYNAMAYRLVRGETLMQKVLADAAVAVSALLARDDVNPGAVGAFGHSYGGNTSLFLSAVDERVRFACVSGALGSYRNKIANGTGIEMAEVIPGFAARFDLEDVVAAVAPRLFFAVSATADKYSADAAELVDLAKPAFDSAGAPEALSHLRVEGGHALDAQRFDAIVEWLTAAAHSQ